MRKVNLPFMSEPQPCSKKNRFSTSSLWNVAFTNSFSTVFSWLTLLCSVFLSTWVCILHNTCTLYNSINALCSLQDAFTLQRKKSLPDVTDLVGVAAQQSSQEMTREEISVLSSARRDNVRRQMDEIERYKSNPVMYILNPRVQVRE